MVLPPVQEDKAKYSWEREGEVRGTLCFGKTPLHPAVGGSVRNRRFEAGGEDGHSDIVPFRDGLRRHSGIGSF